MGEVDIAFFTELNPRREAVADGFFRISAIDYASVLAIPKEGIGTATLERTKGASKDGLVTDYSALEFLNGQLRALRTAGVPTDRRYLDTRWKKDLVTTDTGLIVEHTSPSGIMHSFDLLTAQEGDLRHFELIIGAICSGEVRVVAVDQDYSSVENPHPIHETMRNTVHRR